MERNVSMVLFLNSKWEEFIFSLGNFPRRIHNAGWETRTSELCSRMEVTQRVTLCWSRRLVQPQLPLGEGRWTHAWLQRGWDASTAGYRAVSPCPARSKSRHVMSCMLLEANAMKTLTFQAGWAKIWENYQSPWLCFCTSVFQGDSDGLSFTIAQLLLDCC